MLTDPALRELYKDGENDLYAKKYVFFELYYGYLERTYSFLHSKINPYRNERIVKEYWQLLEPTIKWLLKDAMFREVHKYAEEMREFKPEFISLVSKIAQKSGINVSHES